MLSNDMLTYEETGVQLQALPSSELHINNQQHGVGLCILHEKLLNRILCVFSVLLNVKSKRNVTQMLLKTQRDRNV